jgi:hypothetical protein
MGSAKKTAAGKKREETAAEPKAPSALEATKTAWDNHPYAFHFMACGPPILLLCNLVPPRPALYWFAAWLFCQIIPPRVVPERMRSLLSHALTVYAAFEMLDAARFGEPDGEMTHFYHLLAALGVGMVMGVAYRNLLRAGTFVLFPKSAPPIGAVPARAAQSARPAAPRAPSVLITLAEPPASSSMQSSREFVVKVLLPTAQFKDGMVYNEARSIQSFVDLESTQENMPTLVRMIALGGGARRGSAHARTHVISPLQLY